MPQPNCNICRRAGKPKCEEGRDLHAAATRYLLKNNLKYDEKHRKLYDAYLEH